MTKLQKGQIAVGKSQGKTHAAIAEEVGLAVATVNNLAVTPEVMELRLACERAWREKTVGAYGEMIEVLREDLRHPDQEFRSKRADQLLRIITIGEKLAARREAASAKNGGGGGEVGGVYLEELYARRAQFVKARVAGDERGSV